MIKLLGFSEVPGLNSGFADLGFLSLFDIPFRRTVGQMDRVWRGKKKGKRKRD